MALVSVRDARGVVNTRREFHSFSNAKGRAMELPFFRVKSINFANI